MGKSNLEVGSRIIVLTTHKQRYKNVVGRFGTITQSGSEYPEIGVNLDGMVNHASLGGIFWFRKYEVELLENYEKKNGGVIMEGNYKIAVVNLVNDCNKKDYGYALFENAQVGDWVVVNSLGAAQLGAVVRIVDKSDFTTIITKEVIGVVSMDTYNQRVQERERLAKIEKEKKAIQKELDTRIARVKDLEYYEKYSQALAETDPGLTALVKRFKELSA